MKKAVKTLLWAVGIPIGLIAIIMAMMGIAILINHIQEYNLARKAKNTIAQRPVAQRPASDVTLEYKLATINAGYRVESSDPAIYQFSSLLDNLERKCSNSRQQIADATVAAHQQLGEKGVRMTLMEVMKNLNNAIPAEAADSRVSIAEIAAAFVVLTDREK